MGEDWAVELIQDLDQSRDLALGVVAPGPEDGDDPIALGGRTESVNRRRVGPCGSVLLVPTSEGREVLPLDRAEKKRRRLGWLVAAEGLDLTDPIAHPEPDDHLATRDDFTNIGVVPNEMIGRHQRDEELRASGVRPRRGDADPPRVKRTEGGFIGEDETGTAPAVATGVATLNHEVRHNSVEGQAVIEAGRRQVEDLTRRDGRLHGLEADAEGAAIGGDVKPVAALHPIHELEVPLVVVTQFSLS